MHTGTQEAGLFSLMLQVWRVCHQGHKKKKKENPLRKKSVKENVIIGALPIIACIHVKINVSCGNFIFPSLRENSVLPAPLKQQICTAGKRAIKLEHFLQDMHCLKPLITMTRATVEES